MHICKATGRPLGLVEINSLTIDRKKDLNDFSIPKPTVCLSLTSTLFYMIKATELADIDEEWVESAIEVSYQEDGPKKCRIIPRPGLTQLLVELERYCSPMIYSSESDQFIDAALLALSIAQGDPEQDDCSLEAGAYMGHCVWSMHQCVPTELGYKKSLGTLSEFTESGINDIWIIDHNPQQVDIPSRVLTVPKFSGDLSDRALFKLMDQIFIN
ncbi:NIF family HAD-type phosphatase [Motiliproteus sp.]|uniref:NIF family HAD-type phosphatase n=1 Tax=Motiliproteus sp. TaxID=1898955 RepID=UPI003BAA8785